MKTAARVPPFSGSSREALGQGRRDKAEGLPPHATCDGQSRRPGRKRKRPVGRGTLEIVAHGETSSPFCGPLASY